MWYTDDNLVIISNSFSVSLVFTFLDSAAVKKRTLFILPSSYHLIVMDSKDEDWGSSFISVKWT